MRRLISDVCLFVLLPLWLLVGASQAQFNNFPPGTFNSRAALDATGGGGGGSPIAFVGAADGGNATATSLTFSYTTGSGTNRLLVVSISGDTVTDDVTGATYNAIPMVLGGKKAPGASNRWNYLFYLIGPASGANNVVVSASSSHFLGAGAADYTGVNVSGQPDASTTNSSGGTVTSLTTSITTVSNNAWAILSCDGFSGSSPPGAGTGATRRTFDASFGLWGIFDSGGPITPAGSYGMTTTYSGGTDISHVIVSFVRS